MYTHACLRHVRAAAATADFRALAAAEEHSATSGSQPTGGSQPQHSQQRHPLRTHLKRLVAAVSDHLGHSRGGSADRAFDTTVTHYIAPPVIIHWALEQGHPRAHLSDLYPPSIWEWVKSTSARHLGWIPVIIWCCHISSLLPPQSHSEGDGDEEDHDLAVILGREDKLPRALRLKELEEMPFTRFVDDVRDYLVGKLCSPEGDFTLDHARQAREYVQTTNGILRRASRLQQDDTATLQRVHQAFGRLCAQMPMETWGAEASLHGGVWWTNSGDERTAGTGAVLEEPLRCSRCSPRTEAGAGAGAGAVPAPSLRAAHTCQTCAGTFSRRLCGIFAFVTIYVYEGGEWRMLCFEMASHWGLTFNGCVRRGVQACVTCPWPG